jgi:hypothetical protein
LCNFLHPSITSSLLGPNIFLRTTALSQSTTFLYDKRQVYTRVHKIIVFKNLSKSGALTILPNTLLVKLESCKHQALMLKLDKYSLSAFCDSFNIFNICSYLPYLEAASNHPQPEDILCCGKKGLNMVTS